MSKFRVAVSDNRHGNYDIERKIIESCDGKLDILNCVTEEDMISQCADYDAILLDMAPASTRVIEALKNCKVIVRYGVGYDNVDIETCTRKGIIVSNVPDYCMEDVSDMMIALLFSCLRRTALKDRLIRTGKWNINAGHMYRLRGKTLSLLGFGRIAQAVYRKLKSFNLSRVLIYDPYITDEFAESEGVEKVNLEVALKEGDIISLHLPVTDETIHLIDREALGLMKRSAFLINTSRGALIEDDALIDALVNEEIAGAGLDTHNSEPLDKHSTYLSLDNCVLTDHSAFNTIEGVKELKQKVAESAKAVLTGKAPAFTVNG